MKNRIFSVDNSKALKANAFGWINAIHYLAPHTRASVGNLCAHASPGCIALCLGEHSGAAIYYPSVIKSRIAKAQRFMKDRKAYLLDMRRAIASAWRKAQSAKMRLCVRLNGSSDVVWEAIRDESKKTLLELFPKIQFTDYTKNVKRALQAARGEIPKNYCLVFSRSETNEAECLLVLAAGGRVAIVFGDGLPKTWNGYRVVNGDKHDLLHLQPKGVILGLTPKGPKAKKDRTGFVLRAA